MGIMLKLKPISLLKKTKTFSKVNKIQYKDSCSHEEKQGEQTVLVIQRTELKDIILDQCLKSLLRNKRN